MSRAVFLGTSRFAADVLRRLADSPHRPVLAVAPPDRHRGRGRRLAPPPVADEARTLGIELVQAEDVNARETVERIGAAAPDVVTLCAFGQLLAEPLLSDFLLLNVHPSLLPRWRGAAPIERAIMARDRETGASVMRVTEGLDSGPVVLQESTPIGPEEDCGSLSARLSRLGAELLVRSLDLREARELELHEQDDEAATYAEKIAPEERRLDPGRSAEELAAVVRALTPHVGTYIELEAGGRLGVGVGIATAGNRPAGALEVADGELRLGCAEGVLRLLVVQPEGGKPMAVGDYLRGHPPPAAAV